MNELEELQLCKICKVELNNDPQSNQYDCGGDCKKCIKEFEKDLTDYKN